MARKRVLELRMMMLQPVLYHVQLCARDTSDCGGVRGLVGGGLVRGKVCL